MEVQGFELAKRDEEINKRNSIKNAVAFSFVLLVIINLSGFVKKFLFE